MSLPPKQPHKTSDDALRSGETRRQDERSMSQNRAEEHRVAQAKDALRDAPKPEAPRTGHEALQPIKDATTRADAAAQKADRERRAREAREADEHRQKVTAESNVVKANEPEMAQTADRRAAMGVPDDMSKRVPQFIGDDLHARPGRNDARLPPAQRRPAEEIPAHERMFVSDELAAILSDKYAHHDIKYTANGIEVHAGGECISIDAGKVGKCKNNAELRAYIASIPVL